ncbi:MAG: tRNA (N(6)-L-threonylcarbamoyladenosine(37)-C(2))-methylthiotransferase MtaB [Chlorobiaceae bacterium]|nr:tRNA (N(6)-L-threonylcarbamoyladenosine(37)-C(2))-methylthiotransferase MtaB [Chlorobiaceae bacterium]
MSDYIKKRVAAVTLGCKLNYSETSYILEKLCSKGWSESSFEEGAELVIIHTCAVTKQAEKKCRQKIRGIIKHNPGSRIAVIGCYCQLNPQALSAINGVDAILGSKEKFEVEWYDEIMDPSASLPLVKVSHHGVRDPVYPGYSSTSVKGHDRTRAFLKIQDGCDYGCSYCTIPLIRGRSRSLPSEEIVARARILAASGYPEIVLTGVNIGDYRENGTLLPELLRRLEEVPVNRIRISSIEPDVVDSEFIALVARSKNIVPHLHIPLQSGSDRILEAMHRRYDTALYRSRVNAVAAGITDCSIGADVMVGFPGESEEDFLQICSFIEELPLAYLHVFSCSIRPGTTLARKTANRELTAVSPVEIARRSRVLNELGRRKESAFKSRYIGRHMMVLFEQCRHERNGIPQSCGYTRNYLRVMVDRAGSGEEHSLAGRELPVHIEGLDDDLNLHGRLLS